MDKTFDLETLLPHRAPMLLLSKVVDYSDDFAEATVCISEHSPFFDRELDGVPAWVGIEYMAQVIGIWAGHQQMLHNKPVQAGFLLGSRRYTCNTGIFPAGCTLLLSAKPVYRDDSGLGAFDCTISSNAISNNAITNNIVATAQIKAFRPEDPRDFVRPFSTMKQTGLST